MLTARNAEPIAADAIPQLPFDAFHDRLLATVARGARLGALFGVPAAIVTLPSVFSTNPKMAWLTIGLGVLTALLFLVPFVVWTQDGIPYYSAAAVYAVILAGAMCFVGYRYLRRNVPAPTDLAI